MESLIVTELFWFIVGIGLGGALTWSLGRRMTLSPSTPEAKLTASASPTPPPTTGQETLLAYRLATEMSQFQAGFLARTSHELRSPLNSIIGLHQLILSNLCDDPEEEREFIAQAHESALKMVRLLDELIEISRLACGRYQLNCQPLSLKKLLSQVHTATYLQAANRRLSLQVVMPETDAFVCADCHWLEHTLLLLVDQAIGQSENNSIQISSQIDLATAKAWIWLDSAQPLDIWQEPRQLSQNEPTPNQVGLSSGISLLVCQQILALMGGTLQPANLPPNLTTHFQQRLQCTLPLAKESDASSGR